MCGRPHSDSVYSFWMMHFVSLLCFTLVIFISQTQIFHRTFSLLSPTLSHLWVFLTMSAARVACLHHLHSVHIFHLWSSLCFTHRTFLGPIHILFMKLPFLLMDSPSKVSLFCLLDSKLVVFIRISFFLPLFFYPFNIELDLQFHKNMHGLFFSFSCLDKYC